MKFKSKVTTNDGRLDKGKIYQGGFVSESRFYSYAKLVEPRIIVFDNNKHWTTFEVDTFDSVEGEDEVLNSSGPDAT